MSASPPPIPSLSPWHPAAMIATWGGIGRLPKAPGTWGSLAALPFAWVLCRWGGAMAVLIAAILCAVIGWWAAARYVRNSGLGDPQEIVVDEVAGQWLVLAALPADPLCYGLGFLLFRLLDITKPGPIGWADRAIGGGLGVMADDILAGLAGGAVAMAAVQAWGAWQ